MFLSDSSLKRPVAMSVLIIAMVIMGINAYLGLGLEFLPSVDTPIVTILTTYPGAGPKEVETLVTEVIEEAVSEVNGIDELKSVSMENVSQIIIEFDMEMDVNFAAIDVKEKVDAIIRNLPDDADPPVIMKFDPNSQPVANMILKGNVDLGELYNLADNRIKDYFTKIPGVANVDLFGGKEREIHVLVDQDKLNAHQLGLLQVLQALQVANLDLPSGRITENRREYSVRLEGEFESLDDISNIDLINSSDKTVRLSEVATVKDAFEEQRKLAYNQGIDAVGITLKKQGGSNTVEIVERVEHELGNAKKILPEGVDLVLFNEKSGFIISSNEDVVFTMFFGILLTAIVLIIFLHDIRQTIIAAISMPVSIISTFMLLQLANFTLNVMSMMALAISVGILVTNSIVVIENIYRHVRHGKSVFEASGVGTSEVTVAVLGSTMTNIVVFVPIALMKGIIGQFFYQFGITVAFATIVSMFVSFTLTPILSSKLVKTQKQESGLIHAFGKWFDKGFIWLTTRYTNGVKWSLKHRLIVLLIAVVLLFGSFRLAGLLGTEFMSTVDQGEVNINVEMAPGTAIEQTDAAFKKIESYLNSNYKDIISDTYTRIGTIEGTVTSTEGVHVGTMLITLIDKQQRTITTNEFAQALRKNLDFIPGSTISVMLPSPVGGTSAQIQLEMSGPSLEMLARYEPQVLAAFNNTAGTVDIASSWRFGKPEILVRPKRQKIKDLGLDVQTIALSLRGAVEGLEPGEYRDGDETYDIKVRLNKSQITNLEQIAQIAIPISKDQSVPLSDLATIEQAGGPLSIYRYSKQKTIEFTANPQNRPLGDVVSDIDSNIADLDLPSDITFTYTGNVQMMGESFAEMGAALLLSIILTYLVLAAILESFLQPLTIMMTLPLALIGVILALVITGQPLGIFSMLAVIMLVGIVVNNGILIIEYITSLRQQGMPRSEAIIESCRVKLRPITMTTLATVLGMLPLALSNGMGAELRVPMGIVTIGGLSVSAVMTLFVIPVLYTFLDAIGKKKNKEASPAAGK